MTNIAFVGKYISNRWRYAVRGTGSLSVAYAEHEVGTLLNI